MDEAMCPCCGYRVGLGIASEPGTCPDCSCELMLACEFRAFDRETLVAEAQRRAAREPQRI